MGQTVSIDQYLYNTSYNGDLEKAKRAIENGADVNAKHNGGMTPLHIASLNGHESTLHIQSQDLCQLRSLRAQNRNL
jgi:ankyrin repeat protein